MSFGKILFFGLLTLAAGCGTDSSIRRPPETNFIEGQKLSAKGKYEEASAQFKKVKENTTSPVLATAAGLMNADALFNDKNYIEAAAGYEEFTKLHPDNEKAPYALYRLGLCHFKQAVKIDTDQTPLTNAAKTFESFFKEYPQSDLAGKVREALQMCRTKQSEYELYVARFYFRTGKYPSAITRLKEAIEKYPVSPVNDEALFYLGQAYIRTGDKAKGKEALQRLINDFKTSNLVEKSRKILANNA
jgi:outer membrane protein assembly factor BamD